MGDTWDQDVEKGRREPNFADESAAALMVLSAALGHPAVKADANGLAGGLVSYAIHQLRTKDEEIKVLRELVKDLHAAYKTAWVNGSMPFSTVPTPLLHRLIEHGK